MTTKLTKTALLLSTVASTALISAPVLAQNDASASQTQDVITVTARRR